MAKILNMPDNYPEFRDYIVYKNEGNYILRAKTAAQMKKEAARVKAGLEAERIALFEWVNHYKGE